MMTTVVSLRRVAVGGTAALLRRAAAMGPVTQVSCRSTTAVNSDDLALPEQRDAGTSARCPFNAASERGSPSSADDIRPMHELDGPTGWPVVGNFLTYLKKENRGKMHEVQVGALFN